MLHVLHFITVTRLIFHKLSPVEDLVLECQIHQNINIKKVQLTIFQKFQNTLRQFSTFKVLNNTEIAENVISHTFTATDATLQMINQQCNEMYDVFLMRFHLDHNQCATSIKTQTVLYFPIFTV